MMMATLGRGPGSVALWATAGGIWGRGDGTEGPFRGFRRLWVHWGWAGAVSGPGGGHPGDPGPGRGKFRLGVGLVRLAGAARQKLDVVQESRPVCRALAQEVGETVNLAILSGRDALYLDQVAGPAALSPHNWAGQRIPLHATSDGKVLLAYLPEAELKERLTPPLARFTDRTITDVAEFGKLLAEVRRRGFATAVEELEAGLTAIAAPVRNAEGKVIASISASGPSFRIPADRIPALAAAVRRAAAEVSRRLGWNDLATDPTTKRTP